MEQVSGVLDESIATEGYVIRPSAVEANYIDLSKIDFDLLRQQFNTGRKAIEVQKLRTQIAVKVAKMVQLNKTRMNFLEEFQRMIDEYNSGAANIETFFARLMAFMQKLSEEDKRAISEELTEEELTIFDLLTKPEVTLTKAEEREVKKVAKELLQKLKSEKLVLDWKKRQATRAAVRYTIETVLDELPRTYTPELYQTKCNVVYQHVFDSYTGQGEAIPPKLKSDASAEHRQLANALQRWRDERKEEARLQTLKKLGTLLYSVRSNIAHGEKTMRGPDLAKAERDRQVCEITLPMIRTVADVLLDHPTQKLIAYGTLKPSEPNHRVLEPLTDQEWLDIEVEGTMIDHEGGLKGFRWCDSRTRHKAMLLKSSQLPSFWGRLDSFEGSAYRRTLATALVGELTVVAMIY
jgi:gamma-glutamylcyclotransferase (GGCT)/AIG2-like uncharacterized protein YtfP